jgi:hypothetical protein
MVALTLGAPHSARGYGIYSHAELIDLVWDDSIRPLLIQRYPGITEAELTRAHAYAYGGCRIQDLGYFPLAGAFFSDLTHYVRSGDFIAALLRDASNADELAFAVGALSHYLGDIYAHSEAVNLSVGLVFPKLATRYGQVITFEQDPIAHGRVELGFDMAQIGLHRFAPVYHSNICLSVHRDLLDRAFLDTYGLTMPSVIRRERAALRSYRFGVCRLLPTFMRVQALINRRRFSQEKDDEARREYLENISKAHYATLPATKYWQPGAGTHVLALVIRMVPKVGTLKILSLKAPSPETNGLYFSSMNTAVRQMRELTRQLRENPSENLALANVDLDTGKPTQPGAYGITDDTYARLLNKITTRPGIKIPPGLRDDILLFYSDPNAPIRTKNDPRAWARVLKGLNQLKLSVAP